MPSGQQQLGDEISVISDALLSKLISEQVRLNRMHSFVGASGRSVSDGLLLHSIRLQTKGAALAVE
jgi:hypothetical protein